MRSPRRGAQLPYQLLAGVVPSRRGWLAATAKLQGITMAPETPQVFGTFLEVLDYKPAYQVITAFVPIGLPDEPLPRGRKCDREARKVLRWPRSGAIVSAPSRAALRCGSYDKAVLASGGHLSPISWQRFKKIAEVDNDIAPYWQRTVFEVHPELSYFQLNGDEALTYSKRTQAGREERSSVLKTKFPGVDRILDATLKDVTAAQLLDAAACLWTARRILSRSVSRLPEDPEWDGQGLRMEIVR